MKTTFKLALAACCLALAACGGGLSGDYGNSMVTFSFSPDGTVEQSAMGMRVKMKYRVDGKNLELHTPQGTIVYEITNDGIKTPFGVLRKQ